MQSRIVHPRYPNKYFHATAKAAKADNKTYFWGPSCIDCGCGFYWSHTRNCMHCHPNDADRLGIDVKDLKA